MSTVQCPLCGLRFTYLTQLDLHAREDHVKTRLSGPRRERPVPPPREAHAEEPAPAPVAVVP